MERRCGLLAQTATRSILLQRIVDIIIQRVVIIVSRSLVVLATRIVQHAT